jgi:hypothetical protein
MYGWDELVARLTRQGYKITLVPYHGPTLTSRVRVYFRGRPESPRRYTIHLAGGTKVATATHTASWEEVPRASEA